MPSDVQQNSGMSAVDAQFGMVRIFKPFNGFEQKYQGLATDIPIAMPGVRASQAAAQQPGFDPNLLEDVPVPLGARLLFWFPVTYDDDLEQQYTYRMVWRYRNPGDFRNPAPRAPRRPFHLGQTEGAPDTTSGQPAQRTLIPAAMRSVAFEQAQSGFLNGESQVLPEGLTIASNLGNAARRPVLPDGTTAVVQQGVFDPQLQPEFASGPIYIPYWCDAEGDGLIIYANRRDQQDPIATWDFTDQAADKPFSNVYGTGNGEHPVEPNVGIYMVIGTNP